MNQTRFSDDPVHQIPTASQARLTREKKKEKKDKIISQAEGLVSNELIQLMHSYTYAKSNIGKISISILTQTKTCSY